MIDDDLPTPEPDLFVQAGPGLFDVEPAPLVPEPSAAGDAAVAESASADTSAEPAEPAEQGTATAPRRTTARAKAAPRVKSSQSGAAKPKTTRAKAAADPAGQTSPVAEPVVVPPEPVESTETSPEAAPPPESPESTEPKESTESPEPVVEAESVVEAASPESSATSEVSGAMVTPEPSAEPEIPGEPELTATPPAEPALSTVRPVPTAAPEPPEPPLALYRRYRPDVFADIIGQAHVTEPLRRALLNNRVNHAYLFSGPRGCGKTSSARILARALNCVQGPTPDPCGQCQSCRDLARGGPGSIDVIEIDAATHGGVDDARDLRERAFFAPVHSRYKIYIVDEAHMVTSAGFNALLKLVEEPPPHVKFVFATTEPEKVIGTIRSRTHHYPFRLVPPKTMADHLTGICQQERVAVEPGVIGLVVRAGGGSVRDALSVLDQLLGGAGPGGVEYAQASALLGYTPDSLLDEFVDALAAHDGRGVFATVDKVIEAGQDPRRFAEDLLRRLRDLIIVSAVDDALSSGLIDVPEDQGERYVIQSRGLGPGELTRAAEVLAAGLLSMRGTTAPRLQLELMCARMLLPGADAGGRGLHARLERLERRLDMTSEGAPAPVPSGPALDASARPSSPPPTRPPASSIRSADGAGEQGSAASAVASAGAPTARTGSGGAGEVPLTPPGLAVPVGVPVAPAGPPASPAGAATGPGATASGAAATSQPDGSPRSDGSPPAPHGSPTPARPAVSAPPQPAAGARSESDPASATAAAVPASGAGRGAPALSDGGRLSESGPERPHSEPVVRQDGQLAPNSPEERSPVQATGPGPASPSVSAPTSSGGRSPVQEAAGDAGRPAPSDPGRPTPASARGPGDLFVPVGSAGDRPVPPVPGRPTPPAGQSGQSVPPGSTELAPDSGEGSSGPGPAEGAGGLTVAEIRRHWPRILEELKQRRKFAWMTVSQFAQVTELLDRVLWLTFNEAGARDNFSRSGGEENLRAVVADLLGSDLVIRGRIESDPPPRLEHLAVVGRSGSTGAATGASVASDPATVAASPAEPSAGFGPAGRSGRSGPAAAVAPSATGPAASGPGSGGADSPRGASARHLRVVTDQTPQSDPAAGRPPASQGDRSQTDAQTGSVRSDRPASSDSTPDQADASDSEEGSTAAPGSGPVNGPRLEEGRQGDRSTDVPGFGAVSGPELASESPVHGFRSDPSGGAGSDPGPGPADGPTGSPRASRVTGSQPGAPGGRATASADAFGPGRAGAGRRGSSAGSEAVSVGAGAAADTVGPVSAGSAAETELGDDYEGVAPDDVVMPLSEVGQVADELVRSVLEAEFVRSEQTKPTGQSRGRF